MKRGIVFLLLYFAVSFLLPAAGINTLAFRIVDQETGLPLRNATVVISRLGGEFITKGVTDGEGLFGFTNERISGTSSFDSIRVTATHDEFEERSLPVNARRTNNDRIFEYTLPLVPKRYETELKLHFTPKGDEAYLLRCAVSLIPGTSTNKILIGNIGADKKIERSARIPRLNPNAPYVDVVVEGPGGMSVTKRTPVKFEGENAHIAVSMIIEEHAEILTLDIRAKEKGTDRAIANALVRFWDVERRRWFTLAETDRSGRARFSGETYIPISVTRIRLRIAADGYVPFEKDVVITRRGRAFVVNLEVELSARRY